MQIIDIDVKYVLQLSYVKYCTLLISDDVVTVVRSLFMFKNLKHEAHI